jgi:hypothetical protein
MFLIPLLLHHLQSFFMDTLDLTSHVTIYPFDELTDVALAQGAYGLLFNE